MYRSLIIALTLVATTSLTAHAHKIWLRPSQTVLSGVDPWVTVDAAVSNDLFYFNHFPLRLDNLVITAPDGSQVEPQNPSTGKYRSVFDVQLAQQGTYRLAVINRGLFANWEEDGQPRRWRGQAANFAAEVPTDAQNLRVSESVGRVETFVTNGAPNATAVEPSGSGIELEMISHPNDLYDGEAAQFRVLVDGKPTEGLAFEIIRGETRYRNAQEEIQVTSGKDGEFSVTWPGPGMYWMETSTQDTKTTLPQAGERRLSYVVTLEVLPQ